MPSYDLLVAFFVTTAIFAYIPGPAMLYAAARTLAECHIGPDGRVRHSYRLLRSCPRLRLVFRSVPRGADALSRRKTALPI